MNTDPKHCFLPDIRYPVCVIFMNHVFLCQNYLNVGFVPWIIYFSFQNVVFLTWIVYFFFLIIFSSQVSYHKFCVSFPGSCSLCRVRYFSWSLWCVAFLNGIIYVIFLSVNTTVFFSLIICLFSWSCVSIPEFLSWIVCFSSPVIYPES